MFVFRNDVLINLRNVSQIEMKQGATGFKIMFYMNYGCSDGIADTVIFDFDSVEKMNSAFCEIVSQIKENNNNLFYVNDEDLRE